VTRAALLLFLCSAAMLFSGGQGAAMSCFQSPLEEVVSEADAVFAGTVTDVRRLWFDGFWGPCGVALGSGKCGSKIATVSVSKVWKGDPGETTSVYSQDACNCLGAYLAVGDEMLFVLVRDADRRDAAYRTAFCVRTVPLQSATEDGVIEELDTLLPSPNRAK